ncbi:FMN reductase [NAD(P)H] [Pseudodesulfovibrio hydrargyri]|uniref:FMN reductase [NAD(P)H] n=1 Tax=Pseudodesulfovibrio hydrargyri TaxID=2125990 RepID=A0A1J5NDH6_9BACT|nr:nitroreductase family protein [Pseudodesulfovibrio hydrargyri]OIQ49761.1 FMN reductase [NAD(P)H] [Pseudodesulfovibrio hydrargyri]
MITIDAQKCVRDGFCVQACPANLIRMDGGSVPEEIDGAADRCIRCGHCVAVCPTNALDNALTPAGDYFPTPEKRPDAEAMENLLVSRRSARSFRKKPVSREQLERLLETARRSPTASNSQKLSWTMIQDAQRLDRVRELSLEWMGGDPARSHYVESARQGRDVILRNATALAVVHGPADYAWTAIDGTIALTYMELLAATMGLGTCWAGLVTAASKAVPDLLPVLGVPEGSQVGGAIMLGHPRLKHLLIPPRNAARVTWL